MGRVADAHNHAHLRVRIFVGDLGEVVTQWPSGRPLRLLAASLGRQLS